jgi:IS4 transposase
MQTSASLPADQFNDLLGRLPADLDLDALALETKAIERQRKIESGADLLRLALARGPGGLSLSQTAAWASMIGFAERMSDPAIKFRLDKSVDFLAAVTERQLASKCAGPSLHWQDRFLRISDGTCVSEPGSKRYWRVHAVFDLGRGGFSHLEVTDRREAEALDRGAAVRGEVRIGDRYFARADRLHAFRQQTENGADFIVRLRWNAFRLQDEDGKSFGLIQHLRSLPIDAEPHEVMVQARRGKAAPVLPLRLIVLRKPPEAAAGTRKRLSREASRKQKEIDPRSLVAAEFIILATSLAAEHYPAEEVLAAYRLRWQIELAFKRLKSLLHIDRLPTRTPQASRSWLYSHLILALLCDDLSQDFLDSSP